MTKLFCAIHVPSNETGKKPSERFYVQGYLDEYERDKAVEECAGSMARLVTFESEEQFNREMEELDEEFFQNLWKRARNIRSEEPW